MSAQAADICRLIAPMARIAGFLQIRPGEGRLALLGAAFFFALQAAQVFSANAADALLFQRYGVEALPVLFILLGAATLLTTTAYSAVLGRPDRSRISVYLVLVAGGLWILGWGATRLARPALYPGLWLGIALVNAILGTLIWVLAGEVCDPRQGKRLFAFFASAGILGSVLAGFSTGLAAQALGTQTLLLISAGLLALGAALARRWIRDHGRPSQRLAVQRSPLQDLGQAHRVVWRNPTMRLTAITALLFSVLFFSVSFPFNVQVSAAFPNEADLAGFLGTFGGIVTAVTFLISLFLASRIYARIGVINTILILPLVYLGGFLLWAADFRLETAGLLRFAQLVLIGGLASTAYAAVFNVVAADTRSSVRAYLAGPPAQAGVMLSGLLLLLGQRGLTQNQVLGMGILMAAVCAVLVWRMRTTYGASLLTALREGISDIFSPLESEGKIFGEDSQARSVAIKGLKDSRPSIRRMSARILGRLGAVEAVSAIGAMRSDADPEVRRAAAIALGQIPGSRSARVVVDFLRDDDPSVREAGLNALLLLRAIRLEDVTPFLHDPSPAVRAQAAVACFDAGDTDPARRVIEALLAGPTVEARRAGIAACAKVEGTGATAQFISTLREPSRELRLAAVQALEANATPEGMNALVELFEDPDPVVRRAAATAIAGWPEGAPPLVETLRRGSVVAQEEAVRALAGRNGTSKAAILDWAAAQLQAADRLRSWHRALARESPTGALGYLAALLERDGLEAERRVLLGLGAVGSTEAMRLVGRALHGRERDLRSQAIEALESIGDRRISQGLVRLLEPVAESAPSDRHQVLGELVQHPRAWYRTLALRARAEDVLDEWEAIRGLAHSDPSEIVRAAIAPPPEVRTMIETSATLGIVERVLFLRDVSIFRLLEPEDLERIAAIATERLYAPGEWICREGEVGDELFVLAEGAVEVRKRADGEDRALRALHAGEHVGELAILREQPRSASVIAQTDVRALVLHGEALRSILQDRPEVGLAMLESLAERMSTLA